MEDVSKDFWLIAVLQKGAVQESFNMIYTANAGKSLSNDTFKVAVSNLELVREIARYSTDQISN